jgi:hypothetical protein
MLVALMGTPSSAVTSAPQSNSDSSPAPQIIDPKQRDRKVDAAALLAGVYTAPSDFGYAFVWN